jgi:hypothetical protein
MKRKAFFPPKVLLLLLCFFCFAFSSVAQNAFSGKVVTEKGEPIAGATVSLKNRKASARTDDQGRFHFSNSGRSVSNTPLSGGHCLSFRKRRDEKPSHKPIG